jgi:hypothetical protein
MQRQKGLPFKRLHRAGLMFAHSIGITGGEKRREKGRFET